MSAQATVYHPREPTDSPLWKVLHNHYEAFKDVPNNILYPVPHRQFVFSIPKMLRISFKYDRKLLTQLCHCANQSLQMFFRTVLGLIDGILGMIMVIHTFGDYARFHPHLQVLYRSAMTHGSNKKNFEVFSAEEFIAAITQHIPHKSFQMVRYYGWYSTRSRGERIKAGVFRPGDEPASPGGHPEATVLDVSDHQPRRAPSKAWRELIKRIWEVDPLSCPRCAHEMKIISLIHEPDIIARILRHLGFREVTVHSPGLSAVPE